MSAGDRHVQIQPPYLLTAVTRRHGVGVRVTGDASIAVVEMTVPGQWSPQLGEEVSAGLRLCLAGPSASIIVDLQHLADPYGFSMPFWLAAWRQARLGATPVHLAFCLPLTTALSRRLRNLRGPQPRVFATVPDARIAIVERIPRADRVQVRLAPLPASIGVARELVTQACHTWDLPQLLSDTSLIVSELAANAVEHARTNFVVTLSRSAATLHVAVHDGAFRFPQPGEPAGLGAPLAERGRGLLLVHAIADAWGAMPAHGGKVVWATVRWPSTGPPRRGPPAPPP